MKKSFKIITTLFILLFLSFQYSIVLNQQKKPPSPDWSRSLPTDGKGEDYFKLQSIPTANGYSISKKSFKRWDYVDCDKNLGCEQIWSNEDFDYRSQTWTDGNTSYFIKDGTLFRSSKVGDNVPISSSVIDFIKTNDILVYWLTDNKLIVQRGTQEPTEYITDEPVWSSYIVGDQVFVVYKSVITNTVLISKVNEDVTFFTQFKTKAYESIYSMDLFSLDENQYSILLEIGLKSAGSLQKYIQTANLSKTNPEEPTFSTIKMVDKVSGETLRDMNYPSIFNDSSRTYLTFSATMFNAPGSSNHVFVGEFNPERIEASAVTKRGDLYTNPVMINDETIIYYKKVGPNKEMMYSSTRKEKKEISAHGLKGDAVEAFQELFTQSFKGILLALLSFLWIVPATGASYGVGGQLQKRGNLFVSPIMYTVYMLVMFVIQYLAFSQLFHADIIASKIPYLSEVWHVYMILVIAIVVSILPLWFSRTKITDDNANRAMIHATLLNLVILVILIGPYFF